MQPINSAQSRAGGQGRVTPGHQGRQEGTERLDAFLETKHS